MDPEQSSETKMPPPMSVPSTAQSLAQAPSRDQSKMLFGIAAIVLAVGLVVVSAVVLVPFSKQYLAERKVQSVAELELKKQQLELDKLKTGQAIVEQNRANVLADEKAKQDALAREKDRECGVAGTKYFSENKKGAYSKFANFELTRTHYNSRMATCLIEVKYSRGLQGQFEIHNVATGTQLRVRSWGTIYPNDLEYDKRETAEMEMLMSE
jgi:hypothetical protein